MPRYPPIGRPFPNVSNDIVQIVLVLWELCDRRCTFVSVLFGVLRGKITLPDISPAIIVKHEFSSYVFKILPHVVHRVQLKLKIQKLVQHRLTCADRLVSFYFPKDRVCRIIHRGMRLPIRLQSAGVCPSSCSMRLRRSKRRVQQDDPF